MFCTRLPSGVLVATLASPGLERAGDRFTQRWEAGGEGVGVGWLMAGPAPCAPQTYT